MLQTLTLWDRTPSFNDVLRPGFPTWTPARFTDFSSPVVDIYEDPERIVVTLDIPGVQATDIDVDVQAHRLTIHAARRRANSSRSYNQQWSFGAMLDAENAFAHLEDGVLTVILPKVAARKITVQTTNPEANSSSANAFGRFWSWIRGLFTST